MYVGELDLMLKEEDFLAHFKNFYDSVYSAKIIMDVFTRQSKGYGFVKFRDPDEFQVALNQMNGYLLLGKSMKVK